VAGWLDQSKGVRGLDQEGQRDDRLRIEIEPLAVGTIFADTETLSAMRYAER
jgi:hypothetical protein